MTSLLVTGCTFEKKRVVPSTVVSQVMTFSWSRCTNWATLWVWSIPTTLRPSWLPSTSGWKRKTLSSPMTISEASSNFTVSSRVPLQPAVTAYQNTGRSCLRRVRIRSPASSRHARLWSSAHIRPRQAPFWPQHLRWPL